MELPPSNGKTLLITGINGYIASVLGHLLLTKGYNIRGTVRSRKGIKEVHEGAYSSYTSRIEIFEVPNITIPGAFDEAVRGISFQILRHCWRYRS